jgi:hypothetical protein
MTLTAQGDVMLKFQTEFPKRTFRATVRIVVVVGPILSLLTTVQTLVVFGWTVRFADSTVHRPVAYVSHQSLRSPHRDQLWLVAS